MSKPLQWYADSTGSKKENKNPHSRWSREWGTQLKVDGASDSLLPHREAGSLAHMSATSTSCLNNRPSVVSRKPRLFCETHPLESRPLSHVAHIVYPTREHLRCLGQ